MEPEREIILSLLRQNGQILADDADFSFARIGEGKGFVSSLFRVRVDGHSYAVKITNAKGDGSNNLSVYENMHNREVEFYRWASKLPQTAQNQFKLPKHFGGRRCNGDEAGIVILDDFSDRMIGEIDYIRAGLSVDLVKEILQSVASYQSGFLHADKEFPDTDKKTFYQIVAPLSRACIDELPLKPWITEAAKRNMHLFIDQSETLTEEYPDFAKFAPRTLVHCDLWPENMLYTRRGADVGLLAVIDWQQVTVGNGLIDVAAVLSICLTADGRRASEKELVEFYWREMQKQCAQLGNSFDVDLETTHKLYRHCLKRYTRELAMMIKYLKRDDFPEVGNVDGPLSQRLKALLEDLEAC
ncbi:hypothetical protein PENTCL1PPCAC_4285 [Pristionchus entomophagus]|uniref:CHK kinase-like domain-containing protein n=1 Tax=Pristionchus entomophagus TaxID=358040 RepID=A0AAV5SPW5_9BILA|nr:hypothetical protein PENTCL1PPCAC_4285 [Pristionchus entomophagus]